MSDQAVQVARPRLLTPGFSALLVAQVCFGYAFSSFFLLPKYLVVELGAGPTAIGTLTAAHGLAVVVFLPLIGAAVDRFGRRDFLTAGGLVMAVASFGFVFVDEVGPLIHFLRVVQGLAFAMAFAAGSTLAVDEAPPERVGQAIGIFGLAFLSMNAVAPAVVETVATRAGWSTAFATACGGALLSSLLSRRLRDHRPAPEDPNGGAGLFEVATRPRALVVLAVIALVGSAMSGVFNFGQAYAIELGIEKVSSFFVAYAVAAVTVRAGFGHLIDQKGHRRASIVALALYAAVVLSVVELGSLGLVTIGAGLGITHGVFYPAFNAFAVGRAVADERGKVMSLFQASFQLGMSCGGFGLGLLADRAGYPAVFQAGAVCLVLAFVLLLGSPHARRA
jgi:predicted MFS family arabinose efflux permease